MVYNINKSAVSHFHFLVIIFVINICFSGKLANGQVVALVRPQVNYILTMNTPNGSYCLFIMESVIGYVLVSFPSIY